MKKLLYTLLLIAPASVFAQLKVGNNPASVNTDAVFEAESANKGMLIPRVALTATNSASPLSSFTAGMVVYNTATAGLSPNQVAPGYYYCDGTKWVSAGASLSNVNITNPTSPAGNTIGQMVYNTNSSSGLPVGPVYWNGTKWVAVGSNANTSEVFTNGTPPVAPYLTGTTGVVYTDTLNSSPTLGNQFIWNGSSFVSYISPNATAFYNQNTTNDAGSAKTTTIYRPGSVGVGSNTIPNVSAQLDVNSTTKGFLPPRLTTTQRNAIVNPASGLVIYNTIDSSLQVNTGSPAIPRWTRAQLDNRSNFFYAPTVSIPVTALVTNQNLDLWASYNSQFSAPAFKNNAAPASIPTFANNQLNYYITSYDNTIIKINSLSDTGVLNYDVISTTPSFSSYINVVFTVK